MGIIIDTSLPAAVKLSNKGFRTEPPGSIKPDARLALINLMPIKTDTEYDFLQLIAPSRYMVEIKLVNMASHQSRHADPEHMKRYYTTFDDIAGDIDGVIVTGAPLDHVAFEDVTYWEEMTGIFRYIRNHHIPAFYVCWGAFASLYFWHGIGMHAIDTKISGVFAHHIYNPSSALMKGVTEGFKTPHSRYVVWHQPELSSNSELEIIAGGNEQGPYIVASKLHPEYYVVGHGEYSADTLDKEYRRDLAKGINPHIPTNYYPDDNPSLQPPDTWHDTAVTIMNNWIEDVINRINK